MRNDNRPPDALRPFAVTCGLQPHADASVLMRMGRTHVLCGVTVESGVPPFLRDRGQGWITAEYGMLPCATSTRTRREAVGGRSGRTYEIQRLIGRSLRMMVDLRLLGEYTLRVDCDVLNADGGTRCAAITGGALAVRMAIERMVERGWLDQVPPLLPVAAVSAGIVHGEPLLDLDYGEDASAEVDANFVMSRDGRWIEVQTTAEGAPFAPEMFTRLAGLATSGIKQLFTLWDRPLS
ncbi:MAG: ribonuclease PH [Desulfobulbus sp.]|jgi:ribonuclease PH